MIISRVSKSQKAENSSDAATVDHKSLVCTSNKWSLDDKIR